MRNKYILHSIIISVTFLCSVSNMTAMAKEFPSISTKTHDTSYTQTIAPYSNDIIWKYKNVNGILYKRKYNTSTKKWIGDWIKA